MRVYTLAFSIVVHLAILPLILFANLIATDDLPEPRRTTMFVQVAPPSIPAPPPVRRGSARHVDTVSHDAAPIKAPIGVQLENDAGTTVDTVDDLPGIVPGTVVVWSEPEPPPPPPRALEPVRVGGSIRPPQKIRDVAPVYPPIALAAHVEGIVILEAIIAVDGAVQDVRVLRSSPLLDAAAVEAVRQWRYTPTFLNREAVPVVMTVTVSFMLR